MSKHFLSEEDKKLFQKYTNDVEPLKSSKKIARQKPKTTSLSKQIKNEHARLNINYPELSDYYETPVQSETIISYCQNGFSKKRLLALYRNQAWQGYLDLHGHRTSSAKEVLCEFIEHQSQLEHRYLLIIHGKGGHHGEAPILKNLVFHWLTEHPKVLACHSALPQNGGAGALFVVLRKN